MRLARQPGAGSTEHPIEKDQMSSHHLYEDVAAGLTGTAVFALGLSLMSKATLLTGGVPGLALLLQYGTGVEFWVLLIVLNVPFYVLSVLRMGVKLTVRSFLAVVLVAILSKLTPTWVAVDHVAPLYAALVGGALMGTGLLILFRHRASLGGIGILALYAQERFGLRAGYVQLAIDALILVSAFFVLDTAMAMLSLLGTAVVNLVIATNHRPGRYMGAS